ncbi:sporulation integral membrane protein YtvI [Evansella sp. AB-P1]|uniref:sporulation integral membrane protein YtvI n=1 Tax=Evansella sp. AB-P1 TaxID=3037653 RepID=UPI00241C0D89|nr:sporulation integral membrane protein YtvI [Evansella sp. AB-P1]MDG5786061.1 sporulation integral membrane protein YtvI [Evansella sp. AB-P1]
MTKSHGWIIARFLALVILTFGAIWFVGWLFTISYPFWIASILVWMFLPLIRIMRSKVKFPNGLAVLVALLIGLGTLIAFFTGIVFLIIFGVRSISDNVPTWIETGSIQVQEFFNQRILPLWHNFTGFMDSLTPEQQQTLQEGITQLGGQLATMFGEMGQKVADALTNLIMSIPTFLIAFFFIFLAFYFIGKEWDGITKKVLDTFPAIFLKKGREFRHIFRFRVLGFLRAQIILMGIASIIVLVGLSILRIEHALTIALIVGIAEILPYLGSGTILIPWFVYLFITGDISLGIGIAIVYGVTVGVRQTIEPKVLSSSMNLNALSVLISLFIGLQLFGIFGLFIGPFVLVILVILKDIGVIKELIKFVHYGFKEEKVETSSNKKKK